MMPALHHRALLALLLPLALALGACRPQAAAPTPPPLTVYCAAGLRAPVETIARQYEQETGTPIQLQYGGSGALLSSFRVAQVGDLFLAADEGTVADARQYGVVREVLPIVRQRPVIAVRFGNPKGIRGLADLLRPDVAVALANPEAASISRVAQAALGDTWTQLTAHARVMKPTVSEVAGDVKLGAVDAAIVWDSLVPQYQLEAIAVPGLSEKSENASVCVLSFSTQAPAALRFARYLAALEQGGVRFKAAGFNPAGVLLSAEQK